jgi:hypothetical protein
MNNTLILICLFFNIVTANDQLGNDYGTGSRSNQIDYRNNYNNNNNNNNMNKQNPPNNDRLQSSLNSNYCEFDIDMFNCLNINCMGIKWVRKFPKNIKDIVNYSLKPNQFLCSIDFSDTKIYELSTAETFEFFDLFYTNLMKTNQNQTTIKLSFSGIDQIKELKFPPDLNMVLFLRDSNIRYVEPKSLSTNNKLEINLLNVNLTIPSWISLLESSKLKLLSLRNMQNLKEEYSNAQNRDFTLSPITSIHDLKIQYSYLPVLDDQFIFFRLLKNIEQLDLIRCSVAFIKNNIFDKYFSTFRHLKYLTLSNNNINRITDQTFNGLMNLMHLDLDENPIEYISQNTFVNLKKLKYLSLNSNGNNPNIKSISQTQSPVWLFNLIKSVRELKEVNYKTSRLLNTFCNLESVIKNIKEYNENVRVAGGTNNQNRTLLKLPQPKADFHLNTKSSENVKILRLFTQDQLENRYQDFNNRNNIDLYCNVYYVCQYTKLYSPGYDNSNLWAIESFRACNAILTKNLDLRCGFSEKVMECEKAIHGKFYN